MKVQEQEWKCERELEVTELDQPSREPVKLNPVQAAQLCMDSFGRCTARCAADWNLVERFDIEPFPDFSAK